MHDAYTMGQILFLYWYIQYNFYLKKIYSIIIFTKENLSCYLNVDSSEQLLEDDVQVEDLFLEDDMQQQTSNDLEGDIVLPESIKPSSNSDKDFF